MSSLKMQMKFGKKKDKDFCTDETKKKMARQKSCKHTKNPGRDLENS